MDILTLITGSGGALIVLSVGIWAFYTGKVRREAEVIERDKRIEVLSRELELERRARLEEQRARRETHDAIELASSDVESTDAGANP